ncbi:ATP-binding protein [Streptomyces catenulae]|uniref:ATP-binding protein n=1 Tax=Streptomyces catenulae TaxID=66875 RepID=A0ABV2YWP5_9ACTN|nr:ATP-binding protein [Streptomyces catenulae]
MQTSQATLAAPTPVTARVFAQRFSATRRGARLARRLAIAQLDTWGTPYGSERSDTVALLVAELAANAVLHGRVPGRGFELRLTLVAGPDGCDRLRIEVADTRTEARLPGPDDLRPPAPDAESGRGLLVDALADHWEVTDRLGVGKIVRAEVTW